MQLTSATDQAGLAELRRIATEQEALRKAATLVAAGASPAEVFAQITASASDVFGVPFASLIRFLPDETATMVAGCQACSAYVGMSWEVPEDDPGIARTVVETGEPTRIDDHSRVSGPVGEAARALGVGSVVGAPVVVDGAIWGVLVVGAPQDGPPLAADVGVRLAGFTELVTTTLINAEAREEVRSLLDEQAALRRLATLAARESSHLEVLEAVAEEAARVLRVDAIGLLRFEPDETATLVAQSKTPWEPPPIGSILTLDGENIVVAVHRTGQAARMDDWESATGSVAGLAKVLGVRSAVASPIVVEGRLWGTMIAASNQSPPLSPDTESRIVEFTELLATAIANAESREALMRLADERETLRRVAMLIAEGANPDLVFVAVCDEAVELFGAEQSAVVRLEVDEELVVVGTSTGVQGVTVGLRSKLGEWPTTTAVCRTGRTARSDVSAEEVTDEGLIAGMVRAKGFLSSVSAPIVVEGHLWGAMTVSDSRTPLTADTERRIESFTDLIATAIANREARDHVTRLVDEQAALRRVATLVAAGIEPDELFSAVSEEVARLFKADGAAIGRFEPNGSGVVAVGRSKGLRTIPVGTRADPDEWPTLTTVQRTRRAARWSDKLYSSVTAPIMVGGSLWGVLTAGSGATGLPADTEERLEKFGELVATAIANANSRAELAVSEARARELANEQEALRRVATLVAQGATPDEVFSAVAEEVSGIIDIPVVGIHRYEADGSFTMLGIAGETNFAVGSRWPVEDEGSIAATILATGLPARRDDYSSMPGRLGQAMRDDPMTSTVGVPIVVDGSIWGFMVAAAKPGSRPIPNDIEVRLVRFTELVATAVSNATTRTELLTSRARVVGAADETRRRLERDLHDGIQQWLVALALRARKAAGLSAAGESPVQELSGLADDLVAVTEELREISHGIHPAILSDSGLDDALDALARRSAIRVDLHVGFQGRYDPTLEATVYYVVAESITNAVKHAQVSTVAVRGGLRGEAIELEIEDDGVGGADPRRGSGLIGLKDRVDALSGTISVASPAGRGTRIRVRLPVSPRAGKQPPL